MVFNNVLFTEPRTGMAFIKKPVLWLRPSKIGKTQQAILDNEKHRKLNSFCKSLLASKHCSHDFYHRSFVNN